MCLYVRAERTGDWELHLYCVHQMLPHFHAAGHIHYAKCAQLYLQEMLQLKENQSPDESSGYSNGDFTVRR